MTAQKKTKTELIALALQVERDGVSFFEYAQSITRDPRVREVLEKLARQKREHAGGLEETVKELHIALPETGGPLGSTYFPIDELRKAECYVCGYVAESNLIPESCPRCGASRYAFEKEISIKKAWEFAEQGTISTIRVLADAEKHSDSKSRSKIARHVRLEQRFLSEIRKELDSLRKHERAAR